MNGDAPTAPPGIITAAELMAIKFPPFPVLDAYIDARTGRYRVFCPYCHREHVHTPIGGPHPPHCRSKASPYWPNGYRLRIMEAKEDR